MARVSGLKSISSQFAASASSRVTLEFSDAIDLAVAANDVRDAIGRVATSLPGGRRCAADRQGGCRFPADHAPRGDLVDNSTMEDLTLLVENEVIDRLASVEGVADVEVYGDQEKIFRIDVDQSEARQPRPDGRRHLTQALSSAAYRRAGRIAEERRRRTSSSARPPTCRRRRNSPSRSSCRQRAAGRRGDT